MFKISLISAIFSALILVGQVSASPGKTINGSKLNLTTQTVDNTAQLTKREPGHHRHIEESDQIGNSLFNPRPSLIPRSLQALEQLPHQDPQHMLG